MKKIIKTMVLAILMVGCLSSNVFAAVIAPIEPLWDNVEYVDCRVTFDGTEGTVFCDITPSSSAASITGTLTLYESGREIDSWDLDNDLPFVSIIESFTGIKGRTYTLELEAVVTVRGLSETITRTDSAKCS
jgi:hypothetical protein